MRDAGEFALEPVDRVATRCLVCGYADVRTDEVVDGEVILLAECPRCEHRWTSARPVASPAHRLPPAPTHVRPEPAAVA